MDIRPSDMQRVVEFIPGHDKEILGVSAESILSSIILLIFILIVREI